MTPTRPGGTCFGDVHTRHIGATANQLHRFQRRSVPTVLGESRASESDSRRVIQRTQISVEPPFELRLCLFGHGWVALAPHRYDAATASFTTVLLIDRQAVDATLRQRDATALSLELRPHRRLGRRQVNAARDQIRRMLRLDEDLTRFYQLCGDQPRLHWVAKRGGGRLMRSATVFEDLMKLLFTTNTTWSSTETMVRNLVEAAGDLSPSGVRAFPTAPQCCRDAAFYREVVRAGYRADAAMRLAEAFASGELTDEQLLQPQPSEQLWQRLLKLRGFGPYAAGQAMRLCGHYDRLALDSWCRARLAKLARRKQPPADKTVERRYARFAPFQGLALWCELTADWHA